MPTERRVLPTITSVMWHPTPELRARWLRQYGKDRPGNFAKKPKPPNPTRLGLRR